MKTRLQYKKLAAAILIIATTLAVSCKKYLDVKPVSYFTTGFTFENVNNAEKALIGAYANLGGDNGYGIRISMYYPLDDDIMMGQGGTPYPDNERRDISHFNVTPGNTQLAAPFNQLYNGIERANLCIFYIPKMPQYSNGTPSEIAALKRMHGEALTLRALYYTEVIRNWGDVPVQFLPSSEDNDPFKPKTDRDTIYDRLLADLALAETLVPWRTEVAVSERITQGAVRGLRARIALYRGGYALRRDRTMQRASNYKTFYQIAKDECKAIMDRRDQHKLNPSFQAVFKDNICAHKIEPNGEVLLEVAMAGGGSATGDSKLGYYNGPRWNNLGNGALTVLPSYFYSFDSTDTRRDVMCAAYNINSNGTYVGRTAATIVDGKFRRDWVTPSILTSAAQYFGLNWPILRFSDVLLMFAEADNELSNGPTPAAIAAYDEVRARAFASNASYVADHPAPNTYGPFFDAIVKERALELGGEGIRKYDLIRWNQLGTRIAETKLTLAAMVARTAAPWNNYPVNMYYNKVTTAGLVWAGSYYRPNITPTPPTATWTSVNWLHSSITSTILMYYAVAFTPGKSELLPLAQSVVDANPNIKNDYGY